MDYKSQVRLLGLPLAHFAAGRVEGGQYRRGIARGWIAIGGLAVARELALGGVAVARHANDAAVRDFLQQPLGRIVAGVGQQVSWLGLLIFIPIVVALRAGQEDA